MKNILKSLSLAVITALLMFLMFALIRSDFNASTWNRESKGLCLVFMFTTGALMFGYSQEKFK